MAGRNYIFCFIYFEYTALNSSLGTDLGIFLPLNKRAVITDTIFKAQNLCHLCIPDMFGISKVSQGNISALRD